MRERKLVYVPMAVDTVHPGHLNIIKVASGLGQVMVGLFTDEAIASYKRVPAMTYEQRKLIIENIKGVDMVVKQETRDYEPNLLKYKPDYMVHGTDWREGPLASVRARAMEVMAQWGGEIVEPEYTKGISSSALHQTAGRDGVTPEQKRIGLSRLFSVKKFSRILGVYNGWTARIGERALAKSRDGVTIQFDALWLDVDGLALQKGITYSELAEWDLFSTALEIGLNSGKPLMIPFRRENRERFLRQAEQAGVAAIVVCNEDLGERKENVGWFINHRNYQNLIIMAIADELTEGAGALGAEGLVLSGQTICGWADEIEKADIPVLLIGDKKEIRSDSVQLSGVIYDHALGKLADASVREAASALLETES
ncbi:MAG: adenylyltransferase/cytidyltransferase family protein [Clostridium sp.]|nr:adenylyltransferase/cytidyltransferase family protein [Clostridium sp.]